MTLSVREQFWSIGFWLPKKSNWEEIYEFTHLDLKQFIGYAVVLAAALYVIRIFFEE